MNTMNQEVEMKQGSRFKTSYMIKVSIFAALAFVVMYLEFPIAALFPQYLQIDLSEVVVFVGGVVLGPVAVVFIELIKNLLHLILRGGTGGVGELANFMVGVALIVPPVMIYRGKKTVPSLVIGWVVGIVTMVIVASVGNYFIFLPLWGMGGEEMIDSIIAIYAPFNVVKGAIVAVTAFVVHQSIKGIYKHISEDAQ